MSQRGSFVTEYIRCAECFAAAKEILLQNGKFFHGVTIPSWASSEKELPIIAGKVGGLYRCEEIDVFEQEIVPELAKVICHPLRIAVLAEGDGNEQIFTVSPNEVIG